MKTLKVSLVATVAATVAWWFHLPQNMWPNHPQWAAFFLALVLCILLQAAWSDGEKKSENSVKDGEKSPLK